MTDERIKRVLVALDASEANRSALQMATTLARQLNAELQALFVEDINLLRMAELPIAREISLSSQAGRQLTVADMERQLHSQVQRLRRIVETTAAQFNLPVEFRVLRGQVASELSMAVEQMDILVVGKNTQLLRHSEKLGNITRDILITSGCNMLLLQHGATLEKPVAVLYTGTEASQRAMQLAIQLAQSDQGQLNVFYPALAADQQQALQKQVETMTQALDIEPVYYSLENNSTTALLTALSQHKARVLLLHPEPSILDQEQLQTLIRQCRTPVLLVR